MDDLQATTRECWNCGERGRNGLDVSFHGVRVVCHECGVAGAKGGNAEEALKLWNRIAETMALAEKATSGSGGLDKEFPEEPEQAKNATGPDGEIILKRKGTSVTRVYDSPEALQEGEGRIIADHKIAEGARRVTRHCKRYPACDKLDGTCISSACCRMVAKLDGHPVPDALNLPEQPSPDDLKRAAWKMYNACGKRETGHVCHVAVSYGHDCEARPICLELEKRMVAAREKAKQAAEPDAGGGPSTAGKPRECSLYPGGLDCAASCDDSDLCAQTWAAAGSQEHARELERRAAELRAKGDAVGGLTGEGYHVAADSVDAVQASVEADHKIAEAAREQLVPCADYPRCSNSTVKGCEVPEICAAIHAAQKSPEKSLDTGKGEG